MAQSAISQSISRLEDFLGVQLFDRRGKNIFLNEYGAMFLPYAKNALGMLEDGHNVLKDARQMIRGHVRFGVFAGSILLPELLKGFLSEHKDVSFELIQHGSTVPYDLCISYLPEGESPPECSRLLFTEEIYLAVPTSHWMAERREITLQEAAGEGFICLSKNKGLRRTIDHICEREHFRLNIVFESDDPASVRGLIAAGMGVAFVPSISWHSLFADSFVTVRITKPVFQRTLILQWDKNRYLSLIVREFIAYVTAFFLDLIHLAQQRPEDL